MRSGGSSRRTWVNRFSRFTESRKGKKKKKKGEKRQSHSVPDLQCPLPTFDGRFKPERGKKKKEKKEGGHLKMSNGSSGLTHALLKYSIALSVGGRRGKKRGEKKGKR